MYIACVYTHMYIYIYIYIYIERERICWSLMCSPCVACMFLVHGCLPDVFDMRGQLSQVQSGKLGPAPWRLELSNKYC